MATDIPVQDAGLFTGIDGLTWTNAATDMSFTNDGDTILLVQSAHNSTVGYSIPSNTDEDGLSKTISRTIPIGSVNVQTSFVGPFPKSLFDVNGKVPVTFATTTATKVAAVKSKRK